MNIDNSNSDAYKMGDLRFNFEKVFKNKPLFENDMTMIEDDIAFLYHLKYNKEEPQQQEDDKGDKEITMDDMIQQNKNGFVIIDNNQHHHGYLSTLSILSQKKETLLHTTTIKSFQHKNESFIYQQPTSISTVKKEKSRAISESITLMNESMKKKRRLLRIKNINQ
ncbi:hypothetical protein BJ944DRAFT_236091 [Cunninghamella echinulata]|nr:hypothetical protein BJ944DRAFT_236091 [Cunninghamella echinulata]